MDHQLEDFTPHLGTTYELLDATEGARALELIEATPTGSPKNDPGVRQQAFSLLFQSNSAEALPQQIYRLRHPQMGELALFLVPVADGRAGIRYEAVFT